MFNEEVPSNWSIAMASAYVGIRALMRGFNLTLTECLEIVDNEQQRIEKLMKDYGDPE